MIAALGSRFRCITTSLPGYGGTTERRSADDPSIAHVAETVEAVIRKAISGHQTDAMDLHYSTAHKPEVARALGNLFDLATAKAKRKPSGS